MKRISEESFKSAARNYNEIELIKAVDAKGVEVFKKWRCKNTFEPHIFGNI
jgi:hypothetical protein